VIVAHHGGELPLVQALLLGAGTASPLLVLIRLRLSETRGRLRRRRG
jgi:uncharacterized RDD family membrane protein YckC